MRALFEDIPNNYQDVTFSGIVINEVGIPTDTNNRRDLWFRFGRVNATTIQVRAYKTRAASVVASYIASANITIGASQQTVALVRNGTATPDISGQVIVGTFSAEISGTNTYWWGYTAAPDLVVCDNIVELLYARTGSGQALDGLGSNIFTGTETKARKMPQVAILSQPIEIDPSLNQGSTIRINCPIEVHIALAALSDPATLWRECRQYMAAVESILHDENRRSYGEVHALYRASSEGPGPSPSEPDLMLGVVRINAVFPCVWRDDAYPRS